VHFERADEGLRRVLENLLELAGIPSIAAALDRHAYTVAVHDAGHLRRRQEDGLFHAFDTHEAEARAVGTDDAFGDAGRFRIPARTLVPGAKLSILSFQRFSNEVKANAFD
jgi:hypothetical protein